MHRNDILAAIEQYRIQHPDETAVAERIATFVHTYPNCFERSLSVGHITGSAWVVNQPGTHVLLTQHAKSGEWYQLGGHADGDADIRRVALREAEEESGLDNLALISDAIFDIDIHRVQFGGDGPHFHYDVRFALRAQGSEQFTISAESLDLAWFAIDEIQNRFGDRSVTRMAHKWLTQTL